MDIVNNNTSWFLSDEGTKAFSALNSLDDKTIFIYSYLKKVAYANTACKDNEKEKALLKISLLLADAISQSTAEYSQYPALIDPGKNPYIAYLANARFLGSDAMLFTVFSSILRGFVNPYDMNSWLYNADLKYCDSDFLDYLNENENIHVYDYRLAYMVEYPPLSAEDGYIQLAFVWAFLKDEKGVKL